MAAWRLARRHASVLLTVLFLVDFIFAAFYLPQILALKALVHGVVTGEHVWEALLAPVLLALGVGLNKWLRGLNYRWLEWSPFAVRAGVYQRLLKRKWVGLVFAPVLALFLMPGLAVLEELVFRYPCKNWVIGILWGSLGFGLAHLPFCNVRLVINKCLFGAIFVETFMLDKIGGAVVLHASLNLLAVALTFANLRIKGPGLKLAARSQWLCSRLPAITRWGNSPLQPNL